MRKLDLAFTCALGVSILGILGGCSSDADAGGTNATSATDTGPSTTAGSSSGPAESSSSTTAPEDPPTAGSACGGPLGGSFADCVNGNAIACLNEEATCLVNNITTPLWGACTLACEDECDCWAAPSTGTAIPACEGVLPMAARTCILDCNDGRECPDGMRCSALTGVHRACVFDSDDLPAASSGGESTSDASSGPSSSDTGSGSDSGSSSGSSSSSSGGQ